MKKILFFFLLLSITYISVKAQKLYATKSGQITFNATGGIDKIAAVNNQVDSKMLDKSGQIVFSILIKSFKFENQLMEDHFNENYLESTKFPKAEFKGYITNIAGVNFSKDGKYNVVADGDLTIHGVTKKVSVPGVITIASGKATINGTFKVHIKDYGITGLYIGEKIAPEATININCKYD